MTALYGADPEVVDVVALVDDPFAMRETFERIGDLDIGVGWSDATVTVGDLDFLSPVEAAFEYTLSLDAGGNGPGSAQFGRARLVDGTWRVTRSTICRDLQESFATSYPP